MLRKTLRSRHRLHSHFKPGSTHLSFRNKKKKHKPKKQSLISLNICSCTDPKAFPESTYVLHVLFKVILQGEKKQRKDLPEQVQTSWWTLHRVFPCEHLLFLPFLGQSPEEGWNAPSLWHLDPDQREIRHTLEPRRKHPQPEFCQGSKAGRRGHH